MYSLIFLGTASFLLSLLLTPLVRNLFRRWHIVDGTSEFPIPRVGGIAIAISYVLAFLLLFALPSQAGHIVWDHLGLAFRLLPAAVLIFLLGLYDDIKGLEPWHKLIGQIAAASAAYWAGIHINGIAGFGVGAWWNLPLTILWLVACTNAVNLLDGVDGLATGVGLFATCTTLIAALLQNNIPLALATIPLAGCLLGFIRYNFNPATIFLGDCGSLFIGFLLGCYAVLWGQKAATILGMTAPLMALSIPLLDMTVAIARRFLRRQPIFEGDRNHIHHRLLNRGLSPRRVALILYACAAAAAVCSLVMMNRSTSGLVIVVFCLITWIGIQHLGYLEFGVAGRLFIDGAFRRLLNSHISIQNFEEQLTTAATAEDCWNVLSQAYHEFGFCEISVKIGANIWRKQAEIQPFQTWKITVPLSEISNIQLSRPFGPAQQHTVVASFVDVLRKILTSKLVYFERVPAQSETAPAYRTAHAGD